MAREPHPAPEDQPPEGAAFRAVAASQSRRGPIALAFASLAVLAVALLTRQPQAPAGEPIADVTPHASGARSSASPTTPVEAFQPTPISGPPGLDPTVTPHPRLVPVPARVGANWLVPAGQTSVWIQVQFPERWQWASDGMLFKVTDPGMTTMAFGAWSLMHVNVFPCRWSADVFADDDLMGTAEGQAKALSSWWGQDPGMPPNSNSGIAPLATTPRSTTIAGFPAWYTETLIPTSLDLADCDGGQLILWHTPEGHVRSSLGPGELIRLWVVDVDGEVIVIDASTFPAGSPEDGAELEAIVGSIFIEP